MGIRAAAILAVGLLLAASFSEAVTTDVAGKKQLPKVKERARRMTVIAGPIRPPEPDLSKGVPVPDACG